MSLDIKLKALAEAIGADVKALKNSQGDLTSLSTTAKTNLVAAINELYTLLGSAGAKIDDTAGVGATSVTWSADKSVDYVTTAIATLKDSLLDGAGAAFDTFKELQDLIVGDQTALTTLADSVAKRVRFDSPQTLSSVERAQACANIGVGDPEHDFLADYVAAKA